MFAQRLQNGSVKLTKTLFDKDSIPTLLAEIAAIDYSNCFDEVRGEPNAHQDS